MLHFRLVLIVGLLLLAPSTFAQRSPAPADGDGSRFEAAASASEAEPSDEKGHRFRAKGKVTVTGPDIQVPGSSGKVEWAPLIKSITLALGNEEFLKTGAGMDFVVEQITASLCTKKKNSWLPITCSAKYDAHALITLRENLILDLGALHRIGFELSGGGRAHASLDTELGLKVALVALETMLGSAHPNEFALRLAALAPGGAAALNGNLDLSVQSPLLQGASLALALSGEMPRLPDLAGQLAIRPEFLLEGLKGIKLDNRLTLEALIEAQLKAHVKLRAELSAPSSVEWKAQLDPFEAQLLEIRGALNLGGELTAKNLSTHLAALDAQLQVRLEALTAIELSGSATVWGASWKSSLEAFEAKLAEVKARIQVKELSAQLKNLELELEAKAKLIGELRTKWNAASEDLRLKLDAELSTLKTDRLELRARLDTLRIRASTAIDLDAFCAKKAERCINAQTSVLLNIALAKLADFELIAEGAALTGVRLRAIDKLAISLPKLQGLYAELATGARLTPLQLKTLIVHLTAFAEATIELTIDASLRIPKGTREGLLALSVGNIRMTLAAVLDLSLALEGLNIPEEVRLAMDKALCATAASNSKEALQCVVLGAWGDGLLFDINAGSPVLGTDEISLVGDLMLGYQWDQWGLALSGAVNRALFEVDGLAENSIRAGGAFELWWATKKLSPLRWEARGNVQSYSYLFNIAEDLDTPNLASQGLSLTARGLLDGGLRIEPRANWAMGFWAGGGYQFEYFRTQAASADGTLTNEPGAGHTFIFNAKLRGQWELFPRWVVARMRVDGTRFIITRNSLKTVTAGADLEPLDFNEKAVQLEMFSRLFFDLEALRLFGFVPSLSGGFDYSHRISPSYSDGTLIGVLNLGIRRIAF